MIPLFDDLTPERRRVVDILHSVEGWPIDFGKDAELVRRLADLYPHLDLHEQAVAFAAWMSEHDQKKKIKYRARFTNWVKKADEWSRDNRRNRSSHRAPETGAHGATVQAREDW